MDKSTPPEKKAKKDAKLKAQAAAMGDCGAPGAAATNPTPCVTLVSNTTDKDGTEKTVYSFKDISKIKLDTPPSSSDGGESSGKEDPLTFRMAKTGGKPVPT